MALRRLAPLILLALALRPAPAGADVAEIDDDWGVVAGVRLGESPEQLHRWFGNADETKKSPDLEIRWDYIVGRFRGDQLFEFDCGGPKCRIGDELEFFLGMHQIEKKLGKTDHVEFEGQDALRYRVKGGKELLIVGRDRPVKVILRYWTD